MPSAAPTTTDATALTIEQLEPAAGGIFKRARASLGVTSFGMNILELPPSSEELYPEHTHTFDGHEEVYLCLAGSADLVLPDRSVPLDPGGVLVRVGPETRRGLRSGPDGARVLVLGGRPGHVYVPPANSELGGPETPSSPDAASSMIPGTTQTLTARHRY